MGERVMIHGAEVGAAPMTIGAGWKLGIVRGTCWAKAGNANRRARKIMDWSWLDPEAASGA